MLFLSYRPVNLLDSYENRFGNALAFGATTSYCLLVLIGSAKAVLGSSWGTIIDSSPGYVSSKLTVRFLIKVSYRSSLNGDIIMISKF